MLPMGHSFRVLAAFAVLALPSRSFAQVVNGGFELPIVPSGSGLTLAGGQSFAGWNVLGHDIGIINTNAIEGNGVGNANLTFNARTGLNSVDLTGGATRGSVMASSSGSTQSAASSIR